MTTRTMARNLMRFYPRIFFACHLRHRRDPKTGEELSACQGSTLDHLDEVDGTRVGELASHMGVTPGTMSINIDRLERKGYVVRMGDMDDGRRVIVRLTKAGARVKEANSVLDPGLVEALLEGLAPYERQAAIDGLRILAAGAERLMTKRTKQPANRAG